MNKIKGSIINAGMTLLEVGKMMYPKKENETDEKYKTRISYNMYRNSSQARVKHDVVIKIAEILNCSTDDLI